jgi:xanthine dehydrogenase YagS FAD-binding subunit
MELFELFTANTIPDAVKAQAKSSTAQNGANVRFIAGGTNLIDYMKLNVERPTQLVDINSLPLDGIEKSADGGLKIGALARNADVAQDATV